MMRHSDTIGQIAQALAKAQTSMRSAKREAQNPHFRSRYADLASIDEACRPHLSAVDIALSQFPGYLDGQVWITTMLMHKSGEWLQATLHIPLQKVDAQGIGSALTYARRYTLAALAGVAAGDDDDGEAAVGRGGCVSSTPLPPPTTKIDLEVRAEPSQAEPLPVNEAPEPYPVVTCEADQRRVYKAKGDRPSSPERVLWCDVHGRIERLDLGDPAAKRPTKVVVNGMALSSFGTWSLPEGVGDLVALRGITRTVKTRNDGKEVTYWNYTTAHHHPDTDMADLQRRADEIPF